MLRYICAAKLDAVTAFSGSDGEAASTDGLLSFADLRNAFLTFVRRSEDTNVNSASPASPQQTQGMSWQQWR
jgi:hypothetical protein